MGKKDEKYEELKRRADADEAEEAAKKAEEDALNKEKARKSFGEALSTRDRLMRNLTEKTVKIHYDEGEHDFVEVRLLSPGEHTHLTELSNRQRVYLMKLLALSKAEKRDDEAFKSAEEEATKLIDEQFRILASICVDPTLDFKYWRDGMGYASDIPATILAEALARTVKEAAERTLAARSFRRE